MIKALDTHDIFNFNVDETATKLFMIQLYTSYKILI